MGKPNVEKMEEKGDIKGLIKALKNKDPGIRFLAALALGGIGDKKVVEPLIEAMRQQLWDEAQRAHELLRTVALQLALNRATRNVEVALLVAKTRQGDRWAEKRLINEFCRKGRPEVQSIFWDEKLWPMESWIIAWALGEMGNPLAVDILERASGEISPNPIVRTAALRALEKLKGETDDSNT